MKRRTRPGRAAQNISTLRNKLRIAERDIQAYRGALGYERERRRRERIAIAQAGEADGDLRARLRACEAALANDIRAQGWSVAVHNDYRLNGQAQTFWLFTNGDRCIKGEGPTDADALNQIRALLARPETKGAG